MRWVRVADHSGVGIILLLPFLRRDGPASS
jgi:hypothetical protein